MYIIFGHACARTRPSFECRVIKHARTVDRILSLRSHSPTRRVAGDLDIRCIPLRRTRASHANSGTQRISTGDPVKDTCTGLYINGFH